MVSLDVVRNVAGILGNVTSVGHFLSPLPMFSKIIKKKSVDKFRPDAYLATLLNCTLWAVYALPFVRPDSTLFLAVNGVGLLIKAVYVGIFLAFSPNKERRRMLLALGIEAVLVAALVLGVLLGARTHAVRSLIVGNLCVIASSMMCAAPLTVMKKVVDTRNLAYMPPVFLLLLGLLNGTCWTVYALIKFDLNIAVPNGLGLLLSLAEIILYLCYYKSTPKKEKNVDLPTAHPKPSNTLNGSGISIAVEQQGQKHAKSYKMD